MLDLKTFCFYEYSGDEADDHILISERYLKYFAYTFNDKFYVSLDFLHEFIPKNGDAFNFLTKITEIFIEISETEFYSLYLKYNGREYEPD